MKFLGTPQGSVWYYSILQGAGRNVSMNISAPICLALIFVLEFIPNQDFISAAIISMAALIAFILPEAIHLILFKFYSIKTESLIIYPTGIEYRLKFPKKSKRGNIFIWLSSPAFSICLATILIYFIPLESSDYGIIFLQELAFTSLTLGMLNLLPIAPLDSFQALRAVLKNKAHQQRLLKASLILSFILFFFMLNDQSTLGGILALVLTSLASAENAKLKTSMAVENLSIRSVMIPANRLICFEQATRISDALNTALTSLQTVFPVKKGSHIHGIISREQLIRSGATETDSYISGLASNHMLEASIQSSLPKLYKKLIESGNLYAVIYEQDTFAGLIILDNLNENLMVRSVKKQFEESQEDELKL